MMNKNRLKKLEKAIKTKEFEPIEITLDIIGAGKIVVKSYILKGGILCPINHAQKYLKINPQNLFVLKKYRNVIVIKYVDMKQPDHAHCHPTMFLQYLNIIMAIVASSSVC